MRAGARRRPRTSSPCSGIQATAATNQRASSCRLGDRAPDALDRVARGGARCAARGGRRWSPGCRSSWVLLQVVFEGVECASQWLRYGSSQSATSASGSARRPYQRRLPSGRTSTSPASRSTLRCLETPGWLRPRCVDELVDAPLAVAQEVEDLAAGRLGERGVGGHGDHITSWQYEVDWGSEPEA